MTRYLIDTQVAIWAASNPSILPKGVKKILLSENVDIAISHASVWEIAIKKSLGKLNIEVSTDTLFKQLESNTGIYRLPLRYEHFLQVEHLPFHHRDPFDRLLISHAMLEDRTILSSDAAFDSYGKALRMWK